jgi:hypothetical protein
MREGGAGQRGERRAATALTVRWGLVALCARAGRPLEAVRSRASDALAQAVAAAPAGALARQWRLLDMLLLATRRGLLAEADVARRLADDRVLTRLLGSALRWGPMGARDPADPPRLAWPELRELARAPLLRSRIADVAGAGVARDAWDRLAVQLAVDCAAAELVPRSPAGPAPAPRPG